MPSGLTSSICCCGLLRLSLRLYGSFFYEVDDRCTLAEHKYDRGRDQPWGRVPGRRGSMFERSIGGKHLKSVVLFCR